MLAVKEGIFLDSTIDKLTLTANFKDGIETRDFIEIVTSSRMPYRLQGYFSRNFGYREVIRSEGIDAGYIELKEDTSTFLVPDKVRILKRKREIEEQILFIHEGKTSQVFDLPSLEELYSSLDTIAEQLETLDEEGNLPDNKKTHRSILKDIRFEFNPKHMKYNKIANDAIMKVLELVKDIDITGIHIALDYEINISDLKIQDLSSKKKNISLGRDNALETMYIGKRGSDNQLCIYNKKAENKENDSIDQYPDVEHVTRFEARLRKEKAKEWINSQYNPFDSVIIADLERLDEKELKLNDRIILEAIMQDNEGRYFGMMDKQQKRTWRNKIKTVMPKKIDIAEDYTNKKALLIGQLTELTK
mgnify:CR=1 FL=1